MKTLINHYESILSILAFIISTINLIYLIFTNKKKVAFKIENYTSQYTNNKYFYIFNIEFVNKSRLPISINDLTFIDKDNKYSIIKTPRLLADDTIYNKEIHSTKFPINITGLTSEQKFIVMHGPKKFEKDTIEVIILTNRGKIKKKIHIKKYYLTFAQFSNDVLKYYVIK